MFRNQHFILTLGRSGSNTLVDALNQNPALLNFGEVLGNWMPIRKAHRSLGLFRNDDARYLDAVLGNALELRAANLVRNFGKLKQRKNKEIKYLKDIQSVGVKEFSVNLRTAGLVDYLSVRPHIKVIGLVRRNPLDRLVSVVKLQQSGVVKLMSSPRANAELVNQGTTKRFTLDPSAVVSQLEIIDAENRELEAMLDTLPSEGVLRIDYDDLYSSPKRTLDILKAAQEFLGVSPVSPRIRMRKIIQSEPLDLLANGEEVRAAIRKSRFADLIASCSV